VHYLTSVFYPLLQYIRPSLRVYKNITGTKNKWKATNSEPQFIV